MSIILGNSGSGQNLKMQAIFNGDQPEHYFESFRLLKKYIEDSLDLYKEELKDVLFPIYAHLFLGMIKNGHIAAAKRFFQEERYQFSSDFREDLVNLEQVDDSNKLQIPDIAKYLSTKSCVKISIYALQLLIHFVKLNQLILLLQILNQNLNF